MLRFAADENLNRHLLPRCYTRGMALPLEALEVEALELSARERARLAHRLLESLDEDVVEDPEEVKRAWAVEIERRLAAYDAGEMEAIPASEVLAEARRSRRTAE